jgi:hypothetical protein
LRFVPRLKRFIAFRLSGRHRDGKVATLNHRLPQAMGFRARRMQMKTKPSKDTLLMSTLLAAALTLASAVAIHSSEQTRARDAALLAVKSATLIVNANLPAPVSVPQIAMRKTIGVA